MTEENAEGEQAGEGVAIEALVGGIDRKGGGDRRAQLLGEEPVERLRAAVVLGSGRRPNAPLWVAAVAKVRLPSRTSTTG